MYKIWQYIQSGKIGKYKVRNEYKDGHGGLCIVQLICDEIKYEENLSQGNETNHQFLDRVTNQKLCLTKRLPFTMCSNMSQFQIQHTPKQELLDRFKETIIKNDNRVSLRDMVLLNDNSEVSFDDFMDIFRELDI